MSLAKLIRRHPRLPRLLVLRTVAVAFALGGCVPATAYEEAQSAASVEREGHRRAATELKAARSELKSERATREKLAARLKSLQGEVQAGEEELAQVSLKHVTSDKAREQQKELVTQLRGELARVGGHLRTYESDKSALSTQLEEAETRLKEKEREIALLESQVDDLKRRAETSKSSQKDLSVALDELAALQKGAEKPKTQEESSEKSEPTEEPKSKVPAIDEPAAEQASRDEAAAESSKEPVEEVRATDESAPSSP